MTLTALCRFEVYSTMIKLTYTVKRLQPKFSKHQPIQIQKENCLPCDENSWNQLSYQLSDIPIVMLTIISRVVCSFLVLYASYNLKFLVFYYLCSVFLNYRKSDLLFMGSISHGGNGGDF